MLAAEGFQSPTDRGQRRQTVPAKGAQWKARAQERFLHRSGRWAGRTPKPLVNAHPCSAWRPHTPGWRGPREQWPPAPPPPHRGASGRRAAASCRPAGGRTWARGGSSRGAPAPGRARGPGPRPLHNGLIHRAPAAARAAPEPRSPGPERVRRQAGPAPEPGECPGARGRDPGSKFMGGGDQPRVLGSRGADRGALPEQRNPEDGCAR